MVMEVRSYLKCEMKILPSVIEELDIVRVFAPAKENWNVLYVELGSEFQADSIFSYTKVMKGDNRVVRWFPKEMFARYNALEKVAFNIRDRREENKIKTKVKIGQCDLELFTRDPLETNSQTWKRHPLPKDLPKIEINLQRRLSMGSSPPPGRPGRTEMLAEAVQAVTTHQAALDKAAKALAEKRVDVNISEGDDDDEAATDNDKKRQHSSDSEEDEPSKAMRLQEMNSIEIQSKEKSVIPPPCLTTALTSPSTRATSLSARLCLNPAI